MERVSFLSYEFVIPSSLLHTRFLDGITDGSSRVSRKFVTLRRLRDDVLPHPTLIFDLESRASLAEGCQGAVCMTNLTGRHKA